MRVGQKVSVQVVKESLEGIKIGRGVRQGCCMSPNLFNIYPVSYTHLDVYKRQSLYCRILEK